MVGMPWFFEGAELFTLLSPLCYLRDCHDGTTPRALLTINYLRLGRFPLPLPLLETWVQTLVLVGMIGATIPSSPCISICITV